MLAFSASATFGQGYQFTEVVTVPATPVKNQAATGTCWCFATTSFMESELLRMGKGTYDLSEMFIVRQKYMNQLQDNYLRRGDGNIGQGSLSHTFMNAYRQVGIVPEEVYTGINYDSEKHNHSEMVRYMHSIADVAVKAKQRSPEYDKLIANLFDTYLGKLPEKFTYKGKEYTPKSFAESLGLNMDDYIELTSFTHHPYYVKFDVEVPDNWEHSLMYNLPLDEMMQTVDYALNNGYTVCWDGDVSEKGFSFTNGVAINPEVKKVRPVEYGSRTLREIRREGTLRRGLQVRTSLPGNQRDPGSAPGRIRIIRDHRRPPDAPDRHRQRPERHEILHHQELMGNRPQQVRRLPEHVRELRPRQNHLCDGP